MVLLSEEERLLPPSCGFNFRDFGGYATADGRHVRYGMLYRAGLMAHVDDAGQGRLAELGIVAICDLRSTRERARWPTRWHEGSDTELWARDYGETSADLSQSLRDKVDADTLRAKMIGLYTEIAYEHASSFRAMFDLLLRGRVPLLVNCSAGKDRTGTAVALVLSALGVPRATVMADYQLTGRADFAFLREQMTPGGGERADREDLRPLWAADPVYLQTLFAALEARNGSIEGYLAAELGVGPDERARLVDLLVTA